MKQLTAQEQARAAAQRILDTYNIERLRTQPKALRYTLRRVDAVGVAAAYCMSLLAAKDAEITSFYLGVFYENPVADIGRRRRCHVRVDHAGVPDYTIMEVDCHAPWEVFARHLVQDHIDFTDTVLAGVRRISYTLKDTLASVVIHVAPV